MRIAVIEIDYHVSDLDGFCRIAEKSDWEVVIFTTKKIFDRIKSEPYVDKFKWNIDKNNSVRRFLLENKEYINSFDIIYLNTLASNYTTFLGCRFTKLKIL